MWRPLAFLKERKVRIALLFIFLALLPASLAFMAWLVDFEWWSAEMWSEGRRNQEDARYSDPTSEEYFQNLDSQLPNVRCPARVGKELTDYWRCLWESSITKKGREQHDRILFQNYLDDLALERKAMELWYNYTLKRKETGKGRSRRVRRQAKSNLSDGDIFLANKMKYIATDLFPFSIRYPPSAVKKCQQGILPAVNIQNFLLCIRSMALLPGLNAAFGHSFNATFQPTTFPPLNGSTYNKLEFQVLEMVHSRTKQKYQFVVDFEPLGNEEHLENFVGADPYFDGNWSPYRYRYNSMSSSQRQPGWSYRGKDGPKSWHQMDLERFHIPLKQSSDLSKLALITEFAQTYPGTSEIAAGVGKLETPLDYSWTKDSGRNIYTRFLLPLLDKNDLIYYQSKGLIEPTVHRKSDAEVLQEIINGMDQYLNKSSEPIAFFPNVNPNPKYPTGEEAPFAREYLQFLGHYFNIDTGRWLGLREKGKDITLAGHLENVRQLMHAYVTVVKTQFACLKEMVNKYEYQLEDPEAVNELIDKVLDTTGDCKTAEDFTEAIKANGTNDTEYRVTWENLYTLYDNYFARQHARRRYSLPAYPIPFPVCKNRDPSPIDINTKQTRQSTIGDYKFGAAAYRLSRFFMFFPLDSSALLTVGMVDAERMDGSAVELTGGAVRGQYLTFQYMHIRFANDWKGSGSEHYIDGKGATMELQMVFTIGGSADPLKYWHILARVQNRLFQFREKLVIILSVLVDVVETDEALKKKIENENLAQDPYVFEPLAQAAYHFRKIPQLHRTYEQPRGYVSVDPVFRFIDFIPRQRGKVYTYRGSLSWPPCFGYVIWSVFEERLYMSKRQFDQFVQIPAFGMSDNQFAHDNVRRFEDIYVEEEDDPRLSYDEIKEMQRARTVDRYILVGMYHGIHEGEGEVEEEEQLVGEEIYYANEDTNGSSSIQGALLAWISAIFMLLR